MKFLLKENTQKGVAGIETAFALPLLFVVFAMFADVCLYFLNQQKANKYSVVTTDILSTEPNLYSVTNRGKIEISRNVFNAIDKVLVDMGANLKEMKYSIYLTDISFPKYTVLYNPKNGGGKCGFNGSFTTVKKAAKNAELDGVLLAVSVCYKPKNIGFILDSIPLANKLTGFLPQEFVSNSVALYRGDRG